MDLAPAPAPVRKAAPAPAPVPPPVDAAPAPAPMQKQLPVEPATFTPAPTGAPLGQSRMPLKQYEDEARQKLRPGVKKIGM